MPQSLASVIDAARHRLFIGREREREVFTSALEGERLPFHILSLYGPGGVGKTNLVHALQQVCEQHGVANYRLDGRDIEPSISAFAAALHNTLSRGDGAPAADLLRHTTGRTVLFIDTFEALGTLDRWIREEFIPGLSTNVLLVLSGRLPLPAAWRSDPGLSPILHVLPLRNLSTEESRQYLDRRDVPRDRQEALLSFAHGHPLALSLLADTYWQNPEGDFIPVESMDTVAPLLQRFIQEVPSETQRMALEAASIVNYTNEALLSALLGEDDVHGLFMWLRELSFMEANPRGIFPHDIVREVLVADLQWRDPARFNDLRYRASRYYTQLLKDGRVAAHEQVLTDYVFAHRHNPIVTPFFAQLHAQWQDHSGYLRGPAGSDDLLELRRMVVRHEGEAAAAQFSFWALHPAACIQVYRDAEGQTCGFLMMLGLDEIESLDQDLDPAVCSAVDYLEQHAPLRPEERATLFRFWMDGKRHQAVSLVQSLIFVDMVRHYLTTPRLAFTFLPCAKPEYWQIVLGFGDINRLHEAGFTVQGQSFGVFGHDWRTVPPGVWLERIADRVSLMVPSEASQPNPHPTLLVLGEQEFSAAIKEALKSFPYEDRLRHNPLLRSRLVLDAAAGEADVTRRITALQQILREEAEKLNSAPAGAKYYDALCLTYFAPECSQERVAERMDLPFSTFRRHLKHGMERLTANLWQREFGA